MSPFKCAAESSFCGRLNVTNIKTRLGEPTLDKRADNDVSQVRGKKLKQGLAREVKNLMLAGGGQSSFSIPDSSKMLFKRDYPVLVNFDGKKKIGVIMVPSKIIPKYGINLEREKTDDAIKAAAQYEEFIRLANELKKAKRADIGNIPEEDAFSGLEEAFKDSLAALVLHSLELFHPDLKRGAQEFDFYALHAESLTLFAIEVKKRIGNYIPDQKSDLTVAEKVQKQLERAKDFAEEWFGADLCKDWLFKPIIFCHEVDETIKPLCDKCTTDLVAEGKSELVRIVQTHIKTHKKEITERHVQDFKLMARYLLFGIAAKSMPTSGRFGKEVAKYMEGVGSWDSILLWCFLTPNQMSILSLPKLVFYSGWGGGKTITGIEACKRWSKKGKVLILVNGFNTCGQKMPLVHSLEMMVKDFGNIEVKQIDFDNDSIEYLQRVADGSYALFLDELPGDRNTLRSSGFKSKIKVLIKDKSYVWVAVSNFDKESGEKDVNVEIQEAFEDFEVIKGLTKNMRNPVHVKEQVGKAFRRKNNENRTVDIGTIAALNKKMVSPSNLLQDLKEDPEVVLRQVFFEKSIKAVIAARNFDDAQQISYILKHIYQVPHVALVRDSDPQDIELEVKQWILRTSLGKTPNILVTSKQLLNGSDIAVVISTEDAIDDELGDIASRATCQFINSDEFFTFLIESNAPAFKVQDGCFEAKRSDQNYHNGSSLVDMVYNVLSGDEPMTKDEFKKTLQKPCDKYSSGLMEILFKACATLKVCFQLMSSDSKSGQIKKLTYCLEDQHENCTRKLSLTCSINNHFLLLFSADNVPIGQVQSLHTPLDPFRSTGITGKYLTSLHYAYAVHPKMNENEQFRTIHNGQTLKQAIKGLQKENTSIAFYCEGHHISLCKSIGDLMTCHCKIFTQTHLLVDFLKGNNENRHYLVVNFTDGIQNHLPEYVTYLRCPLKSSGDEKILSILEATKLHDLTLEGPGLVQSDPLNGIAILDRILAKRGYCCASRSIFFMEFDYDQKPGYVNFEDNFNSCLLAFFQELGIVTESNKNLLEELSKTFWNCLVSPDALNDFNVNLSHVKTFLQNISNSFHQKFKLIAVKDDHLNLSQMYSIKPKHGSNQGANVATAHVLYIFDEFGEMNGFVTLKAKDPKMIPIFKAFSLPKLFKFPF